MQTRELKEYCQRRGWQIVGCYVDTGVSGSEESRPELHKLMIDAHRRRFERLRFGNSTALPDRFLTCSEPSKPLRPSALTSLVSRSKWTHRPQPGRWCSPCWALWPSSSAA